MEIPKGLEGLDVILNSKRITLDLAKLLNYIAESDIDLTLHGDDLCICYDSNLGIPLIINDCYEAWGLNIDTKTYNAVSYHTFSNNKGIAFEIDGEILQNIPSAQSIISFFIEYEVDGVTKGMVKQACFSIDSCVDFCEKVIGILNDKLDLSLISISDLGEFLLRAEDDSKLRAKFAK